jgi:hypothetical protein
MSSLLGMRKFCPGKACPLPRSQGRKAISGSNSTSASLPDSLQNKKQASRGCWEEGLLDDDDADDDDTLLFLFHH